MPITPCPRATLGLLLMLGATPALAGSPFAGEPLYKVNCARCHGGAGMGAAMPAMPDFSNPRSGQLHFINQPDQTVLERIERGRGGCPSFRGLLKNQQILDIIAYMRTLN